MNMITYIILITLSWTVKATAGLNDSLPMQIHYKSGIASKPTSNNLIFCCGAISREDIDPLVVVDGLLIDKTQLQYVDPNHIAKISVLKRDNSCFMFGQDGWNGVIIISTKNANKVKWYIKDRDDQSAVVGASVRILGKNNNSLIMIADNNGLVTIDKLYAKQSTVIEVSCIGYKTKIVQIPDKRKMEVITLEKNICQMDSVFIEANLQSRRSRCCCLGCMIYKDYGRLNTINSALSFTVFPNPVKSLAPVYIKLDQPFNGLMEVINVSGQFTASNRVHTGNALFFTCNLDQQLPGIYFVRLTDEINHTIQVQKIIIQ